MSKDSLRQLASQIAIREGKKSQARIGDIREILKLLCTLDAEFDLANLGTPEGIVDFGPIAKLLIRSDEIFQKLSKKRKKA